MNNQRIAIDFVYTAHAGKEVRRMRKEGRGKKGGGEKLYLRVWGTS